MSEGTQSKTQQKLTIVPCTIDQANAFVKRLHRHHGSLPGARLAFAVVDDSALVRGVALVGRPSSRHLDDNWTLEVTRVCTDGCPNACSALYAAAWKAAKAIGYRRLVTYTMVEESGSSLRAVGWRQVPGCGGGSWHREKRPRQETLYLMEKIRWEIYTHDFSSAPKVIFPSAEQSLPIQATLPHLEPVENAL